MITEPRTQILALVVREPMYYGSLNYIITTDQTTSWCLHMIFELYMVQPVLLQRHLRLRYSLERELHCVD